MKKTIIVGSRGSKLALIQAEQVLANLRAAHPEFEFNLAKIVTSGDQDQHSSLDRLPSIGYFVKELEEALLDGRIDLAVHSLKDMPAEVPDKLCLAAAGARVDPRDVLVSKGAKLSELAIGSRIGTGSLRRAAQLLNYRSDLKIHGIRGNIDTRLRKALSNEFDGVILAAAAMIRLKWEDRITEYLPLEHFMPAVGQGVIGIETRSGDKIIAGIVSVLNHQPTLHCVTAERAFLKALGGGCSAPIAALGTVDGNIIRLNGMVAGAGGRKIVSGYEEDIVTNSEQVGIRLAKKVLKLGASQLIMEAKSQ